MANSFAMDRNEAAMHLDQTSYQRQTDPQAAATLFGGAAALGEHVENVRQEFRCNTDAVVAHPNNHVLHPGPLASFPVWVGGNPFGGQPALTARLGELGGVVEQVDQYLGEPRRIRLE